MTLSEQICQEINRKFYFDDFVLANLYYVKDGVKMEICDGLIEFQNMYIIFQIKERQVVNDTLDEKLKWLENKVYKRAVNQIKETINVLKNENNIVVEDMHKQRVVIDNSKKIIPVIIFHAEGISNYKKVYHSKTANININIFSEQDYKTMIEILRMPVDITDYLTMRLNVFEHSNYDLIIDESDEECLIMGNIRTEEDFAKYFLGKTNQDMPFDEMAIVDFLNIISKYYYKRTDNNHNYKQILNRLLCLDRFGAKAFIDRWVLCWEDAKNKKLNFDHHMAAKNKYEKFGFVFISTQHGIEQDCNQYYAFITNLFIQRYKLDTAIAIVCYYENSGNFTVNWLMMSKPYEPDDELLEILKKSKFWSSSILKKR